MPSSFGDSEKNEAFCWPFFGIITNITNDPSNIIQDDQYWKTKFSNFMPLESGIFSNENHSPKHVILSFKSDWGGFKNTMEFEKWFKARGKCREEWIQRKTCLGLRLYGWAAREEDYKSDTPLGEFLRRYTALKTVPELILEGSTSREKILRGLANEVELINKNRNQVRTNYNQKRMTTVEMLREQDKMYQCFDKASKKLDCFTQEHINGVKEEQEMLKFVTESKIERLDSRRNDQIKREVALNEREVELRKREEALVEREKKIVQVENVKSGMAAEEQRKANEKDRELIEVLKRQKEAIEKVLELEQKLDEKHKLETEIEELKDQKNGLENLSQVVIVKELQSNNELQEVRKELMKSLSDIKTSSRAKIGVKRMGEIDTKAFKKACIKRFRPEDAETRALELCSFWQESLKNPQWHPFSVVENNTGIHQRVLNEDDESLRGLKDKWGDEIYDAVVMALKEVNEYNPSGCYLVSEFWNFKENRKATLKEVIGHVCTRLKTLKRKRF